MMSMDHEIVDNINSSGITSLIYNCIYIYISICVLQKYEKNKIMEIKFLADYNYDVDEAKELSFIRENGADISIELKDGR